MVVVTTRRQVAWTARWKSSPLCGVTGYQSNEAHAGDNTTSSPASGCRRPGRRLVHGRRDGPCGCETPLHLGSSFTDGDDGTEVRRQAGNLGQVESLLATAISAADSKPAIAIVAGRRGLGVVVRKLTSLAHRLDPMGGLRKARSRADTTIVARRRGGRGGGEGVETSWGRARVRSSMARSRAHRGHEATRRPDTSPQVPGPRRSGSSPAAPPHDDDHLRGTAGPVVVGPDPPAVPGQVPWTSRWSGQFSQVPT